MKQFHPSSFALGAASGIAILFLYVGVTGLFGCSGPDCAPSVTDAPSSDDFRQTQGQGRMMRDRAGMAERFGMTEEELQEELDSGKTMQDIAAEHGVEMPARAASGGLMRYRDFGRPTGSGSALPSFSGAERLESASSVSPIQQ